MKRECACLRILCCTLVAAPPKPPKQRSWLPLGGVKQCLRVYVQGLPALKRHKWQQPMAWSVAVLLQRAGCPAFVKRGELFAPLDSEGSELVRVDLCAPRAEDV